MKKIFAIALALVMVLSMASAFAQNCLTFDLSSSTKCGMGDVKVVTYVKCNDGGTNNTYLANTGAAAVFGDDVYFSVMITVDEKANQSWWDNAALTVSYSGLQDVIDGDSAAASKHIFAAGDIGKMITALKGSLKAGNYYLYKIGDNWNVVAESDFVARPFGEGHLWAANVQNANTAKVCATLTSKTYIGYNNENPLELNGYTVWTDAANADDKDFNVSFGADKYAVIAGGKVKEIVIGGRTYNLQNGDVFYRNDGTLVSSASVCVPDVDDYKVLKDITGVFGLVIGKTGLNGGIVTGAYGWTNTKESCDNWSAKACAVVDPAAIEIPKTGDVSVVAYAVMALVAAAGAMGLKK